MIVNVVVEVITMDEETSKEIKRKKFKNYKTAENEQNELSENANEKHHQ